jgi:hypothetical protein
MSVLEQGQSTLPAWTAAGMSHLISPDQLDERVVFVEPTVLQTRPQNAVICAHALRSVPPGTFRAQGS